jgi:endoglucanase
VTATPPQPVVALQERAAVMIRVDQVGYPLDSSKRALAMVRGRVHVRSFELLSRGRAVLRGRATQTGRWNRSYVVYSLDFSRERRAGVYTLRFDRSSVKVSIASPSALYRPLADAALAFLQSQRDGPETISGPMRRRPAHLSETSAQVYGAPRFHGTDLVAAPAPDGETVDAAGGWFDAGDYLKLTETASFIDAVLLYTARDYASGLSHPGTLLAEARHGTNWLLQMWNQASGVLYLQVGIGDGTRSERILGDHDVWRLPQHDERIHPRRSSPQWLIAHPPVFAANAPGQPISPNLAGRMAGAFGLCAQVFAASDPAYAQRCLLAGQSIYDRANTHPRGRLVTSFPYTYYTETEWRDDMELGAVELYLGTQALEHEEPAGLPHTEALYYLSPAGYWANAYILARGSGQDSLNLYDVSSLADRDLVRILQTPQAQLAIENIGFVEVPTDASALLKDRHDQLALARRLALREPFGLANPAMPTDTVSHGLGYAIQVRLYEAMGGSSAFDALGSDQLAWVLGANAWGSSFVVGAGSVFPHCLASQIPNLSGSLDGRGRILRGATVNGPAGLGELRELGAPSGYRPCPARGSSDPFRAMSGHGLGYLDDVRSPVTSEPTDDLAALTLLAATQMAG